MIRKSSNLGILSITAIMAALVVLSFAAPVSAEEMIGGDQGWYVVHCNVDGASVYFDDDYKGEISGGVLNVPVYTTGTPYKTYTVSKDGYTTYSADVPGVPAKGESRDLYATLNPAGPTQPAVIGGDQGWYLVHCNVDGAAVYFDNDYKGDISGGELSVPVYTTGTPYQTYTVSKAGYTTFTEPVSSYPGKGETVDLYATLNQAPAPTTKAPLSMATAIFALAGAVLVMAVSRKQ
ncbi:MAG TPA: hypothetical protein PLM96_08300 [Methanoregulaceae archaeon]|nr:hypothetical protein [Methanolinea sp.]MDD5685073.1 hypothetical protein [Methanoregulaceae archaeon]HOP67654.1 hypothetical protein [Methanoregulaceae archaeon]HPJ74730.1 hypothetical protein [Methanoregulaceae archaeon]HPQ76628.1 hypothetical protein [Methanoregulaceae archaeon]